MLTHPVQSRAQGRVLRRYNYCVTDHHQCNPLINFNKRLFTFVVDREGLLDKWGPGHGPR